ncbi:hypothetical protein O6H91_01G091200 [Diphasiastrum complanatum]|uniref:Uncharacterized protein n=4 Tax=Diphasiastrum complanatum TaxID=34168 RepID=A0ACC2ETJ0_DIPCM|nr:hypothetical protein O6H91_01G090800 [Diphasiastrum complanatum]KAJ7569732.1 hypothetical protein O6H91_01G090800 [Diphasiastrum complanatum]KAJ7569736.1 hypothetical protein O6H91_01G091200 [Diphasiastrum complanatum]KAJ7569737.1 hypothetical protein O6H91_01G091200 [Diphasiastrum complanatum]
MVVEAIPDQREWRLSWIDEEMSVVTSGRGSRFLEGGVGVSGGLEMDATDAYKPLPLALESTISSVMAMTNPANTSGGSSSKNDTSAKDKAASGSSRPPRPLCAFVRRCINTAHLATSSTAHAVELESQALQPLDSEEVEEPESFPMIRSGGWTDIGTRQNMEDAHVRIDNLSTKFSPRFVGESPGAFYGVFDGHGGQDAANFVRENLLRFILDDVDFPSSITEAVRHAYLQTDHAFAEACLLDQELSSGTTALTVLITGRQLLVANAGDCRAVLCKRGKAIEMSRDHKAACILERKRIEALGGFVDDGYLNGQLAVARALGDWHLTGLKDYGADSLLTAEPEMRQMVLTEEDEFLIIGCDGLWDVFTSENAVDFARRKLQQHNDPEICSKELVAEALRRDTHDNLTVVTICFHPDPPPRLGAIPTPVKRSISVEGLRCLQDILDGCL